MPFAVAASELVKEYEGGMRALDGVSLQVKRGSFFAVLGPNGAGKTTLMRILTTQFPPTKGSARVLGFDVQSDDREIRRRVSYVPQEMSVWTDITGFENLLIYSKIYGIPDRDERILDVLSRMELSEASSRLVRTYSGGMIRRLEIACALLVHPAILFMDEPTIGLDPTARKRVWETVQSFQKEFGTTVFFNTHYMDEADRYADLIAIMNRGKLACIGSPRKLKESVGSQSISVTLSRPLAAKSLAVLRRIQGIQSISATPSGIVATVRDADAAMPGLVRELAKMKASVFSVHALKPSLDDVFAKYAGASFEQMESTARDVRTTRARIRG